MSIFLESATQAVAVGWAGGRGGPWWLIFPILWIALAATVVWLLVRRRESPQAPAEGAVAILSARFARGEIDSEEYRRRLDELRGLS